MRNIRLLLLRIILYPLFRLLDISFKDTEEDMDNTHRQEAIKSMTPGHDLFIPPGVNIGYPKGQLSPKQMKLEEFTQLPLYGSYVRPMGTPPAMNDLSNAFEKYHMDMELHAQREKKHKLLMDLLEKTKVSYYPYMCTVCKTIEHLPYDGFDKETFLCVECGLSNDG